MLTLKGHHDFFDSPVEFPVISPIDPQTMPREEYWSAEGALRNVVRRVNPHDLLDNISRNKKYKENIVTKQTLDYLVWCDPGKYDKSSKVYRDLKKQFSEEFTDGYLKQVNINRKLLILRVTQEE